MWFDREAGSCVAMGKTDPTSLMVGDGTPDWVRLPQELGGARMRVEGAFMAPCPKCGESSFDGDYGVLRVKHLSLVGSDIGVAECSIHGFIWYRKPNG